MKKLALALLIIAPVALAQYVPPAVGTYAYNASGSSWVTAATTSSAGAISWTPPAEGLYFYNTGLSKWVPAAADSNGNLISYPANCSASGTNGVQCGGQFISTGVGLANDTTDGARILYSSPTAWFAGGPGDAVCFGNGNLTAGGVPSTSLGCFTSGGAFQPSTPITPAYGGVGAMTSAPMWARYFGDGNEGACTYSTNTAVIGEHWCSSVNVQAGVTVYDNSAAGYPLIFRSTGTCTIAGTVSASAKSSPAGNGSWSAANTTGGAGGGGGGGGAAGGTAAYVSMIVIGGGGGGTGAVGTAGNGVSPAIAQNFLSGGPQFASTISTGTFLGGSAGGRGGSSGGLGGVGGGLVAFICPTINYTGAVDVRGANGANGGTNTGGGGGGGGGLVIFSAITYSAYSGTTSLTGGTAGTAGSGTSYAGGNGGTGSVYQFTIQ